MAVFTVDPKTLSPGEHPFKAFRKDGWPLCPCCGADELASNLGVQARNTEPRTYLHVLSGMWCYTCHWQLLAGLLLRSTDGHTPWGDAW